MPRPRLRRSERVSWTYVACGGRLRSPLNRQVRGSNPWRRTHENRPVRAGPRRFRTIDSAAPACRDACCCLPVDLPTRVPSLALHRAVGRRAPVGAGRGPGTARQRPRPRPQRPAARTGEPRHRRTDSRLPALVAHRRGAEGLPGRRPLAGVSDDIKLRRVGWDDKQPSDRRMRRPGSPSSGMSAKTRLRVRGAESELWVGEDRVAVRRHVR
jgi:hypothetical protein